VSDQVTITIAPAPIANAGADQTVCANNASIPLVGNVTNAGGGTWSGAQGTFSPNANALNATYAPSLGEVSAGFVTLTLTTTGNGLCNAVSDQVVVNIAPAPVVNAGLDATVCSNNAAVQLAATVNEKLQAIHDAAVLAYIDPYYAVRIRDSEPLQILHYGIGGHYIPHVDAETLFKDDSGLDLWEKSLDRDLSVVYFLNDDFAGGELFFPGLDLSIRPEAGTLVCFPSDHNYVHGVQPVTAGHRYTLVTWMRIEGMPTIEAINQSWMDEYDRCWPEQIEQYPLVGKGGLVDVSGPM
jgi:hypothetical protein